jgi:hypothetical protein
MVSNLFKMCFLDIQMDWGKQFFHERQPGKFIYRGRTVSYFSLSFGDQYYTNSSWHWGPYGSLWTGLSPPKYYMDWSKLPFVQKWHELLVILYTTDQKLLQSKHSWMHYMDILNTNTKTTTIRADTCT